MWKQVLLLIKQIGEWDKRTHESLPFSEGQMLILEGPKFLEKLAWTK